MLEPQIDDPSGQVLAGLKLVKGNFKISIDDFATNTELIQVFKNANDCAVEVKYGFPLPNNAQLKGFEVFKDAKCYSASLEVKEVAANNYDDHIASGGTAFMGELSEKIPNTFELSIGNFLPGSVAVVKLWWLAPHNLEKDQQTRQIDFPPLKNIYSDSVEIQPISIKLSDDIDSIASTSHKIDAKIDGNTATVVVSQTDPHVFRSIDLTVKSVKPQPSYVVEELTECKQFPYAFTASLSVPFTAAQRAAMKKEREFVFILDCSGSMNGDKITQACRALKLFLASLPTSSKFNIVRFGDRFMLLWPESKSLTSESIQEAMKYSDDSKADMCDTKVYEPLKAVLEAPSLKGKDGEIVPRVVFLLTDGQFQDQAKILALIDHHVTHSSVYTIGIGSDVVEGDLLNIATHGKGQALIVKNMNSSSLQSRIIELLQNVMFGIPSVTLDFGVPVQLAALGSDDIGSVNEFSEKIEFPLAPNRKYTFYGFMKSKPTRALQMTSGGTTTPVATPKHIEGAGLHTIACGALIAHLSKLGNAFTSITNLSLTFGVLSPYTAFVLTEIHNTSVPSYATMITAGLDLTLPVSEKSVVVEPVEEKPTEPVIRFTFEIPHYECQSSAQFNEELNSKFGVKNDEEEYKNVPPSVLDTKPEFREKIAKSDPLDYNEQKQLGELFNEHIMNKRAIQRMLKQRRNEEELLLAASDNKKEHVDKIAEISGVMKKLSTDVEVLYNQFAAIISSYKPFNHSLALIWTEASLKAEFLCSKLTLAPKAEDLIEISNYNSKDYNVLKMEVDHNYAAVQNRFKTELSPTHPDALKIADEYSSFARFVLKDIPKAVKIGKEAFDGAIAELDNLSEDGYKDSTVMMQILRDQLTEMTGDDNNNDNETKARNVSGSKKTQGTVANKADMDKVLFMQHPEGYWRLNDVLKEPNISSEKFAEFVGKEEFDKFGESVWATVLVLVWLNQKFAEYLSEFIMISVKAEQYLEENNALDLIQKFEWTRLLA